jgi:hypothetical protein
MLSVRQRCYVNTGILKTLARPSISVRNASYSKDPPRKTGSLDDLVYNQYQINNKLHLLEPAKKVTAPGTWTVKSKRDEPFPVPVHRFPYEADKILPRGDCGGFQGYRIQYEEILPRCKGKMHKLEWSHLTEEDRFTRRNHVIKNLIKMNTHQPYGDFGGFNTKSMYANRSPLLQWAMVLGSLFLGYMCFAGSPGSNSKMMNNASPDDQSQMEKDLPWVLKVPYLKDILTPAIHSNWSGLFPAYGGSLFLNYELPLWTEHDHAIDGVQHIDADKLNAVANSWFISNRNRSAVKPVPSSAFREKFECYYDGTEGPDKIGKYNVASWKTGECDSNPANSGVRTWTWTTMHS